MAVQPKRNYLTLKQKVEVIRTIEKNRGMSLRELSQQFDCGKTQIAKILKSKEPILSMYESNASSSRVLTSKTCGRQSEYGDVNKSLYEWYTLACSKNIFPMGPQLIEKAKQIATCLGKDEFKGSNGWLEKWKKRYNIKQLKISGESGDVQGPTVDSWKERLPELTAGYARDDIWNIDETGLFWKALPDRGFGLKGKECKGGKKTKQRFTVAFFVTASGKKEKPIVIWNVENPRCLKRFDKTLLPVDYFSQKKAWMDGHIMESILAKLNRRLSSSGRSILLMMDNAGCHPEDLKAKFSNINVCFLPANTTSKLQPLDLGIIQNFKVHYRSLFLRYVLAKIDECDSAREISNSINVLIAIRWVAMAWTKVGEETIRKCFRKAGVLDSSMAVVERDEEDPFAEADARVALQSLINKTVSENDACPLEEYVNGDEDLAVCRDTNDSSWEGTFFETLGQEQDTEESEGEGDEQENTVDDEQPVTIQSYKEANKLLEEVQHFLEAKGHLKEAITVGSIVDNVSNFQLASARQTTLDPWLSNAN